MSSGKWRPTLAFVLGGALAGTLAMSFIGLVVLRYWGPVVGFHIAAIVLGSVIALATAILGWLMVRLLMRPIRALQAYADKAETAPQDATPPTHFGTQELRETAWRVVSMAEALRDREASIRGYSDHVTHELKTPVSAIRAAAELLQDGPPMDAETAALVAQIDGARQQIEAQLDALRSMAQARETRYLGHSTLAEIAPGLTALPVTIQGERVPLPMAAEGLTLVLQQMICNAAEAGASALTLTAVPGRLTVADNGPGISPGNAARVFDAYFTTKRAEGGTGVGLAIVRNILGAHHAQIELAQSDQGAVFEITFERA
ncbi:ATP-binding protein [Actibacterium mucosum]|nr:ATP-binding protein [Actibacterium mucosum]